jgi:hypothetical protein
MFDLKRPCVSCPIRIGQGSRYRLHPERLAEIVEAPAFQCHKTVDYDRYEDEEARAGDRPQQCAGLMAVLHRSDRPNQIMQVAERLGALDPSQLDPQGEAYGSIEEMRAAHIEGIEPEARRD